MKTIHVCLSPALLKNYDIRDSEVVIIDILRATSTIVEAVYNGAKEVIPVDSVEACIKIGNEVGGITAGERDGKVAPGLAYGNSPFEYPKSFISGKTLVITTTNGTKLLYEAHRQGAKEILIGSFLNFGAICDYLLKADKPVMLACAGWKDRVNIEDALFAGGVVGALRGKFVVECDGAMIAETLFERWEREGEGFIEKISHYKRLKGFGLEKDVAYCFKRDACWVVPKFEEGKIRGV